MRSMTDVTIDHVVYPEDWETYRGQWVAIRDHEIVAAAEDLGDLYADERVKPGDGVWRVPRRASISTRAPQRLSTHYSPNQAPMRWVVLEAQRDGLASRPEFVWALVDSGADRTFLPMSVAAHLGITEELDEHAAGGHGVEGRTFSTWSSAVPIYGRVVTDEGLIWGPRFRLEPVFADLGIALLGRADFFRAFTVTFQEHPATPVYHLDAA